MARKRPGYSDHDGGVFNNPFEALRPPSDTPAASPVFEVAEPEASSIVDETPKRAVIRLQKKGRGGKTVTQVTHLGLPSAALDRWCADMRRLLGCGGSVEEETLVFQGDQRVKAAAILEARGVSKVTRG
jgi:translation initiation factor 1